MVGREERLHKVLACPDILTFFETMVPVLAGD